MPVMRLPTEIIWIAKQGSSVRHIHSGEWAPELTFCGRDVWPLIRKGKDDKLVLFKKCKTCERRYMTGLNKLITNAEDAGFEVHTRRGGTKA
jgi:hypothetical protein